MTRWTTQDLLEFHKTKCDSSRALMEKKNHDYAGSDGMTPFANFEASAAVLNYHPVKGLLTRIVDKIRRVNTYLDAGELRVDDESVTDAFEDIVNYAILGAAMLEEEAGTKPIGLSGTVYQCKMHNGCRNLSACTKAGRCLGESA